MKQILLGFLCLIGASNLESKEINFKLMNKANNPFVFYTYNGLGQDTITVSRTDFMGNGSINVPPKYDNVPFMGVLKFADNDAMDLIVSEGSFSFENIDGKLAFEGSLENEIFYNNKEALDLVENQELFVIKYLKLRAAVLRMTQLAYNQSLNNMQNSTMARVNALSQIDVDKMFYTKFWSYGINGFLLLAPSEQTFAKDMLRLLDITDSEIVYNAFVIDLINITNQFGYEDAFDTIVKHVMESGKIKYPQGRVYEAFEMMKVSKGNKVPELEGGNLYNNKGLATILVFHQPDCSHCSSELGKLIKMYPELKKHNIDVVSVSSAQSQEQFDVETKDFLWKDKISDFKGFGAGNFSRFGVIGTPTIYLIDDSGIVLGRFPTIDALKHFIDTSLFNH